MDPKRGNRKGVRPGRGRGRAPIGFPRPFFTLRLCRTTSRSAVPRRRIRNGAHGSWPLPSPGLRSAEAMRIAWRDAGTPNTTCWWPAAARAQPGCRISAREYACLTGIRFGRDNRLCARLSGLPSGHARGNPVQVRDCPAAVSGNESRTERHWERRLLGSRGQ